MPTVLITGASSGLGAEMARQFAALGYDLALCARRTGRLVELKEEILSSFAERRIALRDLDVNDNERVFDVFRSLKDELGTLDRVVVNAGMGGIMNGAALGTGGFQANRQLAMTNFVAALAQVEAAMEIFREKGSGHLVVVSSMAAMRGMPGAMTAYGATKVGIAHLVEGLRYELHGSPLEKTINLTVLYPGYIASEINEAVVSKSRLMVSTERGVRAMVTAIEREARSACVPPFPWSALSVPLKYGPPGLLKRLL